MAFWIDTGTGVSSDPGVTPVVSTTRQYASEGGPGIPPTIPGPEWFNMVTGELLAVLEKAGISPDKSDQAQLSKAISKISLSRANPGEDIVADGQVDVFLQNLGISDSSGYVGRKISEKWIITSSTYTPTPGTKFIHVTIIGGGGGGGGAQTNAAGYVSAGSGGGAGGVARKTLPVDDSFSVPITIGSGGVPGVFSSNQPGDGGTSSFGSYMNASGGGRGNNGDSVAFGVTKLIPNGGGGSGFGGDHDSIGGSGGPAVILGIGYSSGGGGNSLISGGAQPISTTSSVPGIDGRYGSGGSGAYVLASGTQKNGGRGGNGVCIIEEYA